MEKPDLVNLKEAILKFIPGAPIPSEEKQAIVDEFVKIQRLIDEIYDTFNNRQKLADMRDFILHIQGKKKKVKPTIQAMSPTELIELIMRFDTSYDEAQEAYKALQRSDVKIWKDL